MSLITTPILEMWTLRTGGSRILGHLSSWPVADLRCKPGDLFPKPAFLSPILRHSRSNSEKNTSLQSTVENVIPFIHICRYTNGSYDLMLLLRHPLHILTSERCDIEAKWPSEAQQLDSSPPLLGCTVCAVFIPLSSCRWQETEELEDTVSKEFA